ncbi:NAD(P)-dependent oxidoreductase [Moritella sp. 5]|uniref:SDR family oxidoreductase n=1 Tax=Moritella sp. 5 TaxID=2746231 RepID=UPI001BA8F676|nr:NAD(P)-dependent oxidoreductase [Moritella sp. 5]QUM81641.1 NAD(P)-dependent oxidoreductase [Moritella sp. 5]
MASLFDVARRVITRLEIVSQTLSLRKVHGEEASYSPSPLPLSDVDTLVGKTVLISGGSRGIGLAIATACAKAGANVVIAAKTTIPHPKLPGTIYTAAEAINQSCAGRAMAIQLDVRDEIAVQRAVDEAVAEFGSIDILINNASAIHLDQIEHTPVKKFDLMFCINVRGTFLLTQACLPHLRRSQHSHVVTLSPPINLDPKWFKQYGAYTTSKYAMSLLSQSFSEEFAADDIAVSSLWPKTAIATSAVANMMAGKLIEGGCRKPSIMADACLALISQLPSDHKNGFYLDEDVLRAQGVKDFDAYSCHPGKPLQRDLFLDDDIHGKPNESTFSVMKSD